MVKLLNLDKEICCSTLLPVRYRAKRDVVPLYWQYVALIKSLIASSLVLLKVCPPSTMKTYMHQRLVCARVFFLF